MDQVAEEFSLCLGDPIGIPQTSNPGTLEHVSIFDIPAKVLHSSRHLHIFVGPEAHEIDDLALYKCSGCLSDYIPQLASMSKGVHPGVFTPGKSSVIGQIFQYSIPCTIRIVDQGNECRVLMKCQRRIAQSIWTLYVELPFGSISDCVVGGFLSELPLSRLLLREPVSGSLLQEGQESTAMALVHTLSRLRSLVEFSIPVSFMGNPELVLRALCGLPHFQKLKLTSVSWLKLNFEGRCTIDSLIRGFYQFHHLRNLTLPADILCDTLQDALGNLHDLRVLNITATMRRVPSHLPALRKGQFPALKRLGVSGSMLDAKKVIHTFAPSSVTKIYVETESLQNKTEMERTLHAIKRHCMSVKELGIRIKAVHPLETPGWMNLTHLQAFSHLKEFVICHPRPLPLRDGDISLYLRMWPLAKIVSLNPRPRLPPWVGRGGMALYPPPTLQCLLDVINKGRVLRSFGAYLNPSIPCLDVDSAQAGASLREIDIGTSKIKRSTKSSIQKLFPNAKLL